MKISSIEVIVANGKSEDDYKFQKKCLKDNHLERVDMINGKYKRLIDDAKNIIHKLNIEKEAKLREETQQFKKERIELAKSFGLYYENNDSDNANQRS